MDVEAVAARYLAAAVGVQAYLEKPSKEDLGPAAQYVVVEQTGGGSNLFDAASIDVDCYAPKKQRKKAKALAEAVCAALQGLDEVANLYHPEVTNVYRQNDPDTGEARYVVQLSVYVCN